MEINSGVRVIVKAKKKERAMIMQLTNQDQTSLHQTKMERTLVLSISKNVKIKLCCRINTAIELFKENQDEHFDTSFKDNLCLRHRNRQILMIQARKLQNKICNDFLHFELALNQFEVSLQC